MKVNAIVAVGKDNQMGMFGKLPWNNPDDLKWFRDSTEGKPIICGRKTYEDLPSWLKKNPNIAVVSSTKQEHPTFKSLNEALEYQSSREEDVWICGGSSIYKEALDEDLVDELYVTKIDYNGYADTFFPQYGAWASDKHRETINLGSCHVEHYSGCLEVVRMPKGTKPEYLSLPSEVGGLNYVTERPEEPQAGDAYIDTEHNCVMVFLEGEWVHLTAGEYLDHPERFHSVNTEIEADPAAQSLTDQTLRDIRVGLEDMLSEYIGEINNDEVIDRMEDGLVRHLATVYNQPINDVRSSVTRTDTGIDIDLRVPNTGIEYIMNLDFTT